MLIESILGTVGYLFDAFMSLLPKVTLNDIPVIGVTFRSTMVYVVGLWNSFMETLPYARIAWNVFLVVLAFEVLLLIVKLILGSRVPAHLN